MKVNLAAQTLSSSVADALEFLSTELHHPDFEGVDATVAFIRRIDKLFDVLNSRSPCAKDFKAPMKPSNEDTWRPFLLDTCKFLLSCTDVGGRPLYCTPRKTPILGFVISSMSAIGIYDDFIKSNQLNYLLTYKCSQDHLEIFFSSVRARNGWNNNPTCLQFMRTFKKLLLFTKIGERGGNCKVLDDTVVLKVPSTNVTCMTVEEVDVSVCRRYGLDVTDEAVNDHEYDVLPFILDHNEMINNVVTYISGYVVKMIKKIVKCPECVLSCVTTNESISYNPSYRWLVKKNRGGLQVPSEGVVKICDFTEAAVRRVLLFTETRMPREKNFGQMFTVAVAQKFYDSGQEKEIILVWWNIV